MGKYLKRYWMSDGQGMNKAERMGGTYYPYLPDKLCQTTIYLEPSCVKAVADAQQALASLDSKSALIDTEPLARLLLRSEAISSSRIEGLEMPASKLLEYEELNRLGVTRRLDSVEAQVVGNLRALTLSIENIASKPLNIENICTINRILLKGTHTKDMGGIIRTEQNWIGGNRMNPVGAAYVPPEPEDIRSLMDDLIKFINTSELPAVAIAALAHAQFETIHPFADGNGRAGRALIHLILRIANNTRITIPPVSLILATNRERYIANLNAFRTVENKGRNDAINNWIEYFSNTLRVSCEKGVEFEQRLKEIQKSWITKTNFKEGSTGRELIDILPGTPVISVKTAQDFTKKSSPAVRNAIYALENAGILRQNAKNRKSGIYVADDILDAFNYYERSLSTLSGDTSVEKPRRNVPQRRKTIRK